MLSFFGSITPNLFRFIYCVNTYQPSRITKIWQRLLKRNKAEHVETKNFDLNGFLYARK